MNTNDLAMLLLVMLAGPGCLLLFVTIGNFILNAFKSTPLAPVPKISAGSDSDRFSGDFRHRKVEVKPDIIRLLPIHEVRRTEGKLW